ncbi:MAG: hypothetical protein Q8L14_25100 [Myxococcales bacterium]|nr:hypothetical protein [Myxococcales bacterium]
MSQRAPLNGAAQIVAGVALGVVCALLAKVLIWLVPLMMFVGD